ncbi:DUF3889 domain-containing protein [Sporosarcina sp. Te-1]|uniref:DUF3889 domain-containing protein n=1 Tax=Sporosarcina sp. Te-1 TaxID=2818390 RepID=UPI001A9F3789|nr:DUF3889 domain-containing protein [Sporosarcina sp. Te-1]QTD42974.1 DUF3889 domain-containing protein [Sporosarcina sp. Te-1]
MKKIILAFGLILPLAVTIHHALEIRAEAPAYTKWGRVAMKETQSRYPHASIVDYWHIGSKSENNTTEERFKLWLKEDHREFGVFVTIIYLTETGTIIDIEFRETEL